MLKLHHLVFVSLCLLLVCASISLAEDITQPLLADGDQVGTVFVTSSADLIYVTLTADYPWSLEAAAAYIAFGPPATGDPTYFPYKAPVLGGIASYTFVAVRSWDYNTVYIEAYALVSKPGEPLPVLATSSVGSVELVSTRLIADRNLSAGVVDVQVELVDNVPCLKTSLFADPGWELCETHFYVGTMLPDKPAPGQFPFKHENLGGAASDEYLLSLADLGLIEGDGVYLAVHASMRCVVGYDPATGLPVYKYTSAWGEGAKLMEPPGKAKGKGQGNAYGNWAMYFTAFIELPDEEPVIPPDPCWR